MAAAASLNGLVAGVGLRHVFGCRSRMLAMVRRAHPQSVGFGLQRPILNDSDSGARQPHASLALLNHMRELVADQLVPSKAVGPILSRRKVEVVARGERQGADASRLRADMNPDLRKIGSERGLHLGQQDRRQGNPAAPRKADSSWVDRKNAVAAVVAGRAGGPARGRRARRNASLQLAARSRYSRAPTAQAIVPRPCSRHGRRVSRAERTDSDRKKTWISRRSLTTRSFKRNMLAIHITKTMVGDRPEIMSALVQAFWCKHVAVRACP